MLSQARYTKHTIAYLARPGSKGQRMLVASIEESMQSPELQDFLEGMDAVPEEPQPINSNGFLVMLSRTFFLTVPSHRDR